MCCWCNDVGLPITATYWRLCPVHQCLASFQGGNQSGADQRGLSTPRSANDDRKKACLNQTIHQLGCQKFAPEEEVRVRFLEVLQTLKRRFSRRGRFDSCKLCLQRGKLRWQSFDHQLVDRSGIFHVLQTVLAKVLN